MLRLMTAHVRRERRETGAAAVEFGLIVVVFLTLVIGIIQASLWMWGYQVGSHAAREGARFAAVDPCDGGAAEDRAELRVGGAGTAVSAVMVAGATPQVGDEVKVTVTFTPRSIGGPLPPFPVITKDATARIENVPSGGC